MTELLRLWTAALPQVLSLLPEQQRNLYRQELQRFLATSRFQKDAARAATPGLCTMLRTSLEAADEREAAAATVDLDLQTLVSLAEHIQAIWLDSVDAARVRAGGDRPACSTDGMAGEVFFGPRLGGSGRPGSLPPEER